MKHMVLALVRQNGDQYRLNFPEYPMTPTIGRTIEEAVTSAAIALVQSLHQLAAEGEAVKEPSKLSEVYAASQTQIAQGAMPIAVEVDFPGRSVRINVTIEEGLLGQIDRAAAAESKTRSAFLAAAAFDSLSKR